MPINSWPRPCPVGAATGQHHIGRMYGKKTCGGYQCVKTWRQWNFEMQSKYTNYANMTLPERLEADQIDLEIQRLHEADRLQEPEERPTEMPESHKDRFLKMISNLPKNDEERPNNINLEEPNGDPIATDAHNIDPITNS